MLDNVHEGGGWRSLECKCDMCVSCIGMDARLAAQKGCDDGGSRAAAADRTLGESLLDGHDEGFVVVNAGGGQNGSVQGIRAFAKGCDGRTGGRCGIDGFAHGRLAAVGGSVQALAESGVGARGGFVRLGLGEFLRVLDVPLLEGALDGEEGDEAQGLVLRCGVSDRGGGARYGGEGSRAVILEVAEDEGGGKAGS